MNTESPFPANPSSDADDISTAILQLDEAEQAYELDLNEDKTALGAKLTSTLEKVQNVANVYLNRERLNEAQILFQRVLQGRQQVLGPDHTCTLDTVNDLGNLYANKSKLDEAEKMYCRALQGYEKALGPDHVSTLHTIDNLGTLYQEEVLLLFMYGVVLVRNRLKGLRHEQTLSIKPFS